MPSLTESSGPLLERAALTLTEPMYRTLPTDCRC